MGFFYGNTQDRPVQLPTDLIGYLPEKRRHHYRELRSMAETAKSWVLAGGHIPGSVAQVVGCDAFDHAYFEYETPVWGGGTSVTDVMALTSHRVIAVEGKMLECFDDLGRVWVQKNAKKNPRSPKHRLLVLKRYAEAFNIDAEQLLGIRYQLLHRTLSAARVAGRTGISEAWMVVQSFAPRDCEDHARNRSDFDRYVALVGEAPVLEGVSVRLGWAEDGE